MQATGSRHAQAVSNFTAYLGEQARRRFKVSPQNPVELERYSIPQPDLTLIPWSRRDARRHPAPKEVFLIIEVADSSLAYDREEKRRAYASTGIRESWWLRQRLCLPRLQPSRTGRGSRDCGRCASATRRAGKGRRSSRC
jgi:Uma2 family endonuclease